MSTISSAISTSSYSRISGVKFSANPTNIVGLNLPIKVAVLGRANTINQETLTDEPVEVISAQQAAKIYGYGSQIHQMVRILKPINGGGISVPLYVFPQLETGSETATTFDLEVVGTAISNTTLEIYISGRSSVDGQSYNVSISSGDADDVVAIKISNAINSVVGSPITATVSGNTVSLVTKFKGLSSSEISMSVSEQSATSLSYAILNRIDGTGDVANDIEFSLNFFGETWITHVVNPYAVDSVFTVLERFNGNPTLETPTGRWSCDVLKPFMAFFGSTKSTLTDLTDITDTNSRKSEVTNFLCPAPNSGVTSWEVASSVVRNSAQQAQDNPISTVSGTTLQDIPTGQNFGEMSNYDTRNSLLQKGCSTVKMVSGKYEIQEIVSTYHPDEVAFVNNIYNYLRGFIIDLNFVYRYNLLQDNFVKDKVLVRDENSTEIDNAIKPREWKSILFGLYDSLYADGFISDNTYSKEMLQVQVSEVNPNRFETNQSYKRTGLGRVLSTDVNVSY